MRANRFFIFAVVMLAVGGCHRKAVEPAALDEPAVRQLMNRVAEASMNRDFDGLASCFIAGAEIFVDAGDGPQRVTLDAYIAAARRAAKSLTDYRYEVTTSEIRFADGGAAVVQQVDETATAPWGPVRSATSATYTVRLVDRQPRIVRVEAKVIIAGPSGPLPGPEEELG
ncbi:MAG: hypothetical protein M5R36_18750 [Deltaproteobacteria bacterium]|nr:hypothetical protein [Deltaproteobacteria bacterium]